MRRIVCLLLILILVSEAHPSAEAVQYEVDGWTWLEKENYLELWQRKEKGFISENIISAAVSLNQPLLKGYTVIFEGIGEEINPFGFKERISFWKIIYTGFDKTGNIYLKIFTGKTAPEREKRLIDEIIKLTIEDTKNKEKEQIQRRLSLFHDYLDKLLPKEGEVLIIDSSKTIIINGMESIPPLKMGVLSNNSILINKVKKLE